MGVSISSMTKMCNEASEGTLWSSFMPYISSSSVVTIVNRICAQIVLKDAVVVPLYWVPLMGKRCKKEWFCKF